MTSSASSSLNFDDLATASPSRLSSSSASSASVSKSSKSSIGGSFTHTKGGHQDSSPSPFLAPPHSYYRPPNQCTYFPYHTVAATYLMDVAITVVLLLGLLAGLRAIPEIPRARFHQLTLIIMGSLAAVFFVLHFSTPLGAFDGFLGAFGVTSLLVLLGAAPVVLFKEFRDVLHHMAHAWLIVPHILRILHFLYLPMFDFDLLPLAFAGPAGWGGLLVGATAPIMGLALASMRQPGSARHQVLRNVVVLWTLVGCLQLLLVLVLEAAFIPGYIQIRTEQKEDSRYMWHTVFLLVHYTVPLLLVLHGYTLWKLLLDRAPRPTMLWQEDDDEDLVALYAPESPGAQDMHLGEFENSHRVDGDREGDARAEATEGSLRKEKALVSTSTVEMERLAGQPETATAFQG